MRIGIIVLLLFLVSFLDAGCGGRQSSKNDSNQSAEQDSPFAGITDPAAALAEGNRLLDENQTELAISAFQRALKLDPDLAEAHFKLGIAYSLIEAESQLAGGETPPPGSMADSKKPVQTRSNSQKEFEKAVEAYRKWLKSNPKDDVAQFNLGRALNKLNRDDDAEDAFREAVKLKPDATEYQTELGAILIKLAQYHEAIPPLKKALELDPENSRADELLEDAQAGAKRIDFAQVDKDAKKAGSNSNTNSNANVNSNTTIPSNSSPRTGNTNTKAKKTETGGKKPN